MCQQYSGYILVSHENDTVHLAEFLSEDVGCPEIAEYGWVWLHSLLIILWWKSWPCRMCELSMRLVALTADDCMCVGVRKCP